MFGNQKNLKSDDLKLRASTLSLDTEVFNTCLDSGKHVDDIDKEIDEGYSVGVTTAPTFFVNGRMFLGIHSAADIQRIIDEELKRTGQD